MVSLRNLFLEAGSSSVCRAGIWSSSHVKACGNQQKSPLPTIRPLSMIQQIGCKSWICQS